MSVTRKVVWSEGMFLQPHHFQQHDRYLENLVEARAAHLRPYAWGCRELTVDPGLDMRPAIERAVRALAGLS